MAELLSRYVNILFTDVTTINIIKSGPCGKRPLSWALAGAAACGWVGRQGHP